MSDQQQQQQQQEQLSSLLASSSSSSSSPLKRAKPSTDVSKGEVTEATHLFLLTTRCMIPVYDIACRTNEILVRCTEAAAIDKGKELLFKEVNACFRGGVDDFELDKIVGYDETFYSRLWESCDTQVAHTYNSPARLDIYRIEEANQVDKPMTKTKVYFLPGGANNEDENEEDDDDDDDDGEEDDGEENA